MDKIEESVKEKKKEVFIKYCAHTAEHGDSAVAGPDPWPPTIADCIQVVLTLVPPVCFRFALFQENGYWADLSNFFHPYSVLLPERCDCEG